MNVAAETNLSGYDAKFIGVLSRWHRLKMSIAELFRPCQRECPEVGNFRVPENDGLFVR